MTPTRLRPILAISSTLFGSVLAAAQAPTAGQLKLVDLETPTMLASNQWDIRGDGRFFGGSDKLAYGTLELNTGFGHGLGLILRSSASRVAEYTTKGGDLRHGGEDYEAQLKYSPSEDPNFALMAGVAEPNTPAHHSLFGTATAVYEIPLSMINLYAGAKGAFGSNTDLVALSGGFDHELGAGLRIVGDVDPVIAGENTYNTKHGNAQRVCLYGIAFRYSPLNQGSTPWSADLGFTNALGGTTGFELSPGLGTAASVYVAASIRF